MWYLLLRRVRSPFRSRPFRRREDIPKHSIRLRCFSFCCCWFWSAFKKVWNVKINNKAKYTLNGENFSISQTQKLHLHLWNHLNAVVFVQFVWEFLIKHLTNLWEFLKSVKCIHRSIPQSIRNARKNVQEKLSVSFGHHTWSKERKWKFKLIVVVLQFSYTVLCFSIVVVRKLHCILHFNYFKYLLIGFLLLFFVWREVCV